ncbi:hypothetical protein J3E64_002801 [Sphingobium sp. OAS761]|uniref:PilZ domain-containing protein n=1 Tax=Sphingobium sp. OAS761 TaxID=2817901 RepID=UPI0020A138E4|nr:PilZ domain-containing protein [Sphingobium sp. OAS761]MCP1471104.1 hypothetical protein [Sphingobium sp. OAS761]
MEQLVHRAIADRRRERRYHVDIGGTLIGEDGVSIAVMVRNLSVYGALVSGSPMVRIGERMTLILPFLEREATLIWHDLDRCGLLFDRPIDPVIALVNAASMSNRTGFESTMGINPRRMSSLP